MTGNAGRRNDGRENEEAIPRSAPLDLLVESIAGVGKNVELFELLTTRALEY